MWPWFYFSSRVEDRYEQQKPNAIAYLIEAYLFIFDVFDDDNGNTFPRQTKTADFGEQNQFNNNKKIV